MFLFFVLLLLFLPETLVRDYPSGDKDHRQSEEHLNGFKDDFAETSERRGGAHMGFFQAHSYHLELN